MQGTNCESFCFFFFLGKNLLSIGFDAVTFMYPGWTRVLLLWDLGSRALKAIARVSLFWSYELIAFFILFCFRLSNTMSWDRNKYKKRKMYLVIGEKT
jgi:hypothetical protein